MFRGALAPEQIPRTGGTPMKEWKKLIVLTAAAMGLPVPRQEIQQVIDALK